MLTWKLPGVVFSAMTLATVMSALARPALPSGTAIEQDFGTIIRASKWPSTTIEVCWENPTTENAHLRNVVRDSVDDTWGHYSALKFTGWGSCQPRGPGIHVLIDEAHPQTQAVGRYLDAMTDGMVLNFSFEHWRPTCRMQLEFCVAALAVHEFGHAIGFTHEQNRPDAPEECKADAQGQTGDFLVTRFDWHSIMNYCNPAWIGDGKLSELDIVSVQTIYGPASVGDLRKK
jgi:hypothetical protein